MDKDFRMLTIVFSNSCNLDCSYCCVQSKNMSPTLSVESATSFINKYYLKDGPNVVEFYGGEPTLHPDEIYRTIEYCKTLGSSFYFRLYTNGLSSNFKYELFDEILISLDGPSYYENRQRFNSEKEFNLVVENISKCSDLNVGISSVLFGKEKYESVFDAYNKFYDLGIRYFSYEPLSVYQDTKSVVIPFAHFEIFIYEIYEIIEDVILNNKQIELFIAKEFLSSSWYNKGEKTQCSKIVRAISPRGNVYMCRDHAANEEEMFYSPKVIRFINKNNLKEQDGSFPIVESNENNLTPCPVKNIQYRNSGIEDSLYWLKGYWQDLIIRPLYYNIRAINDGMVSSYQNILEIKRLLPQIFEKLKE